MCSASGCRQLDRGHARSGRAYRPALAAVAGGHGQGVFAHQPRRDLAIAATSSRAYSPGMTAPHQGSLEARPVQLGAVRLGQPAVLHRRHHLHLRALLRQRHGRRSRRGPGGVGLHAIDLGHPDRADEPLPGRHGRRRRPAQALHLRLPAPARSRAAPPCGGPIPTGPISSARSAGRWSLATVGAEMSIVFNNAQLPHIVRPERMGWLSGFGWGLGYCGGLIALFIVLAVQRPAAVRARSQDLHARAPGRTGLGVVARRLRDPDVPVHAGYGGPAAARSGRRRARAAVAARYAAQARPLQERAALS